MPTLFSSAETTGKVVPGAASEEDDTSADELSPPADGCVVDGACVASVVTVGVSSCCSGALASVASR